MRVNWRRVAGVAAMFLALGVQREHNRLVGRKVAWVRESDARVRAAEATRNGPAGASYTQRLEAELAAERECRRLYAERWLTFEGYLIDDSEHLLVAWAGLMALGMALAYGSPRPLAPQPPPAPAPRPPRVRTIHFRSDEERDELAAEVARRLARVADAAPGESPADAAGLACRFEGLRVRALLQPDPDRWALVLSRGPDGWPGRARAALGLGDGDERFGRFVAGAEAALRAAPQVRDVRRSA